MGCSRQWALLEPAVTVWVDLGSGSCEVGAEWTGVLHPVTSLAVKHGEESM